MTCGNVAPFTIGTGVLVVAIVVLAVVRMFRRGGERTTG